MSHEIEEFEDGTAAFLTARQDAWHRLGVTLPGAFSAEDAMTYAKLGKWNVRKEPLQTIPTITASGVNAGLECPDMYAIIRDHPITGQPEVLGGTSVGRVYEPIQNEDHADVLNLLTDTTGASFETAGSLHGGKQVFLTMKLPDTMVIGGSDAVDVYIAAINAHDGGASFKLMVTPVRVVCANTLAAALGDHQSVFKIRHTKNAAGHIEQARAALGLTFKYVAAFEEEAQKMAAAHLELSEFRSIVARLIPDEKPNSKADQNRGVKIRTLDYIFQAADENEGSLRFTRWGAYNAVTAYADHYAGKSTKMNDQDARALRAIEDPAVFNLKARAFAAFAA
jgi:phage/plasmid-like protein (TIGR03299 family)